jgi:hypothetical protein
MIEYKEKIYGRTKISIIKYLEEQWKYYTPGVSTR